MTQLLALGVDTLGVYTLWVFILRVHALGLRISDLAKYLLAMGVYTLWVYSLRLRISDLGLYMRVRKKKNYRGPFKPSLFREQSTMHQTINILFARRCGVGRDLYMFGRSAEANKQCVEATMKTTIPST